MEPRDKRLYIGGLCAFDGVLALVLQMLWQPKGNTVYLTSGCGVMFGGCLGLVG